MALLSSLSEEVIVFENSIEEALGSEILIIFAHGCEGGATINGNFVSWPRMASLLNNSGPKISFIAACFGQNIYSYLKNPSQNVIALGGIVDSIIFGYLIAFSLNILNGDVEKAQNTLKSLVLRAGYIAKNPDSLLALAEFKITTPGPEGFSSKILMFKFTQEEKNKIDGVAMAIQVIILAIGARLVKHPNLVLGIILLVATAVNLLFSAFISASAEEMFYYGGGAIISLEFVAWPWPLMGIYFQARGHNEQIIPLWGFLPGFPITIIDPVGALVVFSLLTWIYDHDSTVREWVDFDLPFGWSEANPTTSGQTLQAGESSTQQFNVKNIGPTTETFSFDVQGLPSEYYSIPDPRTVQPGETIIVEVPIHPPLDAPWPATYACTLNVLFEGQVKTSASSILIIQDPLGPDFEMPDVTLDDGQDFTYAVDIPASQQVLGTTVHAKLYDKWGQLIGLDLPEIFPIAGGKRYVFGFSKPTYLGDYLITVTAKDYDLIERTNSAFIHFTDDDAAGPEITIYPIEIQTFLDSDDVYPSFSVSASDPSGIASFVVQVDGRVIGTGPGTYWLSRPSLLGVGPHFIRVEVVDNDADRGDGDRAMSGAVQVFYVLDDDVTPPEIDIQYVDPSLDSDPGWWDVSVADPDSGVSTISIRVDGRWVGGPHSPLETEMGSYYRSSP